MRALGGAGCGLAVGVVLCLASLAFMIAGTAEASAGVILFGVLAILCALEKPGSSEKALPPTDKE